MINGTWRRSLQDVRVRRGADVGSDHHLVMANLKLKLRRNGPDKARQQQFDVIKIKEPTFSLQLKNKFQALVDAEKLTPPSTNDINNVWEQIKKPIHKPAKPAWDADRRKRRNGSQQIHGKPSRAGEPCRRRSWKPDLRG